MEPTLTTPQALQAVLETLKALEPIYHAAHPEATPEKFAQLVAPDFWEVGASGNRYSRDFALKVLSERRETPPPASWRTDDWHVRELGAGIYLLTYTLYQPQRATRRMSVWQRTTQGSWQVIYHQGTVVQA